MSQSERERALVTQWRNTAKRYDFPTKSLEDATYSATLDRCADELAAALDTPQEPTPADETDEQWLERVRKLLPEGSPIPLFYKRDGSINREKTMDLPCFAAAAPPDALPMAVYGVPSTTGKFLVWTGDSKEEAECMADGSRPVIEYQRAAAPRPALSPDAIERMVGKIGQRCVRGHDLFDGAACKEILIEAFRASAPREGA